MHEGAENHPDRCFRGHRTRAGAGTRRARRARGAGGTRPAAPGDTGAGMSRPRRRGIGRSPPTSPTSRISSGWSPKRSRPSADVDAVVHNAGITMWSRFDALADFTIFERLMEVNYLAPVRLTALALPHLAASRGLIVAIASLAGLTGVPERSGYAASKHAMIGFFDSLRIELAGSGVDVQRDRAGFRGERDPQARHRPGWRAARRLADDAVEDHDRRGLRGAHRARHGKAPAPAADVDARQVGPLAQAGGAVAHRSNRRARHTAAPLKGSPHEQINEANIHAVAICRPVAGRIGKRQPRRSRARRGRSRHRLPAGRGTQRLAGDGSHPSPGLRAGAGQWHRGHTRRAHCLGARQGRGVRKAGRGAGHADRARLRQGHGHGHRLPVDQVQQRQRSQRARITRCGSPTPTSARTMAGVTPSARLPCTCRSHCVPSRRVGRAGRAIPGSIRTGT